jgi:hypothetical protein
MDHLDICRLRSGARSGPSAEGLVAILQHWIAAELETCVVAPLVPAVQLPAIDRLRPTVVIRKTPYVLAVDRLAAINRRSIGPTIGSIAEQRDRVTRALDLLLPATEVRTNG